MQRLTLLFCLFFVSAIGKSLDFRNLLIEQNPDDILEWRSSTIDKVVNLCIEYGGTLNRCTCAMDMNRKKYSENQFLALRQEMINILAAKKDVMQNLKIKNFVNYTSSCNTK